MSERLAAIKTVLAYSFRADARRTSSVVALQVLGAANSTLVGLWVKLLTDGVSTNQTTAELLGVVGLAVFIVTGLLLRAGAVRMTMVLREKTVNMMETDLLSVAARSPGLELQENHAHLAQLELWQAESWQFSQAVVSLTSLVFAVCRLAFTAVLLESISAWLLLLPVFGLPTLLLSGKSSGLFLRGLELSAESSRLAQSLFGLTTQAYAAKELRAFCLEDEILRRFHRAHAEMQSVHRRLQVHARLWGSAPRLTFMAGYALAIAYVAGLAAAGRATVGDVLLTAVLAGQVLTWLTESSELVQFTVRTLTAVGRFLALMDAVRPRPVLREGTMEPPERMSDGIRLHNVTFTYAPHAHAALEDVELYLPAGSTVALVGDNGGGKTTLAKLLVGFYQPSAGHISVDGVDLRTIDLERWRGRVSAAFQDYARLELLARESVGVGYLPDLGSTSAVHTALRRADADGLAEGWSAGLETQLGPTFPAGVDLSGGEWQKLALARALIRQRPLLLILDEPAAALDPESEMELFERYAAAGKQTAAMTGGITLLVSHRFSTVRSADLIAVLIAGRVVEYGTHAQLMERGGQYAELFGLQARAYSASR